MEKLDCVIHRLVYGISSFIRLSNSTKNGSSTCHRSFGMLLLTSVGNDGSVVQTQAAFFLERLVAVFLWMKTFQVHPQIPAMDMFVSFCEQLSSKTVPKGETFLLTVCDTFFHPMELSGWQICKFLESIEVSWYLVKLFRNRHNINIPYKVLRKRMGRKKRKTKSYLHLDQVCWVYHQKLRIIKMKGFHCPTLVNTHEDTEIQI